MINELVHDSKFYIQNLKFNIKELQNDKDLTKGIEMYKNIMSMFKDTSFDSNFTTKFNGFYRIMRRSKEWYRGYYEVFKEYKCKTSDYSIVDILNDLYKIDNNGKHMVDLSFASKMLHTLKPKKFPIYDNMVAKALNLKKVRYNKQDIKKRINDSNDLYNDLLDMYTKEGIGHLVSIFDRAFSQQSISDIKKSDFLLWWYGKKLMYKIGDKI